jgi:phage/plasmid-like protein (TIGR03299 family)
MAHNLARRVDGTYMALYVDKPAWHGLGEVVDELQSASQIYKRVFSGRVIEAVPAYAKVGKKIIEVPNFRALADVKAGTVYGYASPEYVPIQDLAGLQILEAITKVTKGKGLFSSAGALGNGARGFASIDLTRVLPADCLAIKGDPSKQQAFLFGDWSHDGKSALNIGRWRNRVDCNNMLDAATGSAKTAGRYVSIRHTGADTMAERITEAERILGFVEADFRLNAALLSQLNEIRIPRFPEWLKGFTEMLIPIPEGMERPLSRVEARTLIRDITTQSKTMTGVPANTAYRAYQGVAEYADHFRSLRISAETPSVVPERRFRSITEGPAADLKARALELIRQEFEVRIPVAVSR